MIKSEVASLQILVDSTQATSADAKLDSLASSAARAETATEQLAKASDDAASSLKAQSSATAAAASSTDKFADSEDSAATRIKAMVAASLAQIAATKQSSGALADVASAAGSAASASDRVATSNAAAAKSAATIAGQTAAMSSAYKAVGGATDAAASAGSKYLQKLQQQLDLLGKNKSEQAAYIAGTLGLSASEQKAASAIAGKIQQWEIDEAAAKTAAKAEDAAAASAGKASGFMGSLGINSGTVAREVTTIGREVATGNFSRLASSVTVLGQNTNIAALAFKLLTNPIVIATAAAAGALVVITKLTESAEALDRSNRLIQTSFASTGNAALLSNAQVLTYVDTLAKLPATSEKEAQAIINQLARVPGITADTFGRATALVGGFATLLGETAPQAAKELATALADPVSAAKQLNDQFGILNVTQQLQIADFERTGDKAGALGVLLTALETRTKSLQGNLTPLQKASNDLGNAWDGLTKSLSQSPVIDATRGALVALLTALTDLISFAETHHVSDQVAAIAGAVLDPQGTAISAAANFGARLAGAKTPTQQAAGAAAAPAAADPAILAAAHATTQAAADKALTAAKAEQTKTLLDETAAYVSQARVVQQLQAQRAALTALEKDGNLTAQARADIEDRIAAIDERLAKQPAESAFDAKKLELTQELLKAQQDLENVEVGAAKGTDTATAALNAYLSAGKNVKLFTSQQITLLKGLATAQDIVNAQTASDKLATSNAKGLEQVNDDLLKATGDTADATFNEIRIKYTQLIKDLSSPSLIGGPDTAGLAQVNKLINVEQAKAQLTQLQQAIQTTFGAESTAEENLNLNITTHVTDQVTGQKQIIALHQQTADELEELIPEYQKLADTTKDPKAILALAQLQLQIRTLRSDTDALTEAFANAFEGSLSTALLSLGDRTKSLKDDLLGFIGDLAQGLAKFEAQQIATQATTALLHAVGVGTATSAAGTASAAATTAATAAQTTAATALTAAGATVTAGATAVSTSALALGTAGDSLLVGAGAIEAAAAQLAAAAAAASASSAVSGAASVAAGFSEGGYTGDGAKLQPAGIVHSGEFVARSEVTQQAGAIAFLTQFNRVGMKALRGYSSGGLVTSAAPSTNLFGVAPVAAGGSGPSHLALRVNPVLHRDSVFDSLTSGPRAVGEQVIDLYISRNPSKYRAMLGVKG